MTGRLRPSLFHHLISPHRARLGILSFLVTITITINHFDAIFNHPASAPVTWLANSPSVKYPSLRQDFFFFFRVEFCIAHGPLVATRAAGECVAYLLIVDPPFDGLVTRLSLPELASASLTFVKSIIAVMHSQMLLAYIPLAPWVCMPAYTPT